MRALSVLLWYRKIYSRYRCENCTLRLLPKAIFLIDFYRNYISHLMLPRCRFHPTCSAYAREAILKKGLWRGLGMSLWRLIRCHPFSRARFFDPVK